jgi:RNA polymerase sigma-70 factor (ECF subfamily)
LIKPGPSVIYRGMRPESYSMAATLAAGEKDSMHPSAPPDSTETVGDKASRARLARAFEENAVFIWRSLRRLGVPREAADDATQQVFLVAARRMRDISEGKERAFLFQSAMRIAMEFRRELMTARGRAEPGEDVLLERADPALRPDDALDQQRILRLLGHVLEAMPMERRAAFVLYEIEGITMAEIASILQIPMGTVASRLRLAREEFRAAVARLEHPRSVQGGSR